MHKKILSALILALSAASPMAGAAIYKWVDSEGNTHYTASPPPDDVESKKIQAPPAVDTEGAQKWLDGQQKQSQRSAEQQTGEKKQATESAQEQADKAEKCASARKRLTSYQRPRVNEIKADGSRRVVPEEERQAEIKKAQDYIQQLCN